MVKMRELFYVLEGLKWLGDLLEISWYLGLGFVGFCSLEVLKALKLGPWGVGFEVE